MLQLHVMFSIEVKLYLFLLGTSAATSVASYPNCDQLSSTELSFDVEYWETSPYTSCRDTKQMSLQSCAEAGFLGTFLRQMIKPSKISFKPTEKKFQKTSSNNTQNVTIAIPFMIKRNTDDPCEIKVHHSKGPAYIAKRNRMKPLEQLGGSFINGGQIIGLTLILTVISGVFIWILDRHKNPVDFPPSFISGSWQGFWWAFVTMTTVGYGDTSPKSVPARLYSILWMLLGMVAFSVLTANVTSSLNYEIEEDLNLFGKTVAVLNGSLARRVAVSEGAKYKEYKDLDGMIAALVEEKNPPVNGFLIDRHVAVASLEQLTGKTLAIGRTVDYDYYIGMSVTPPYNSTQVCSMIKKCATDVLNSNDFELRALQIFSSSVTVVETENQTTSLFEDYDFLIILLALFGILVGGGLIWEYFYYRPKIERVNKVNDFEMEGDDGRKESDKAILYSNEVEEMCEECRAKVEHIMKEEGKKRWQSMQTIISPLDGFSIIGSQLSSIPGVSSIRRIGSEIPHNVQNLTRKSKKNKKVDELQA
ncbi:uncharacterized protein LOC111324830 isoform X2 [Stylophora pistillata]|uniref:uncharacterized protein LOC111324830 isoform X2 n=1 Tax=Stylophora pistillata TaxID=50429 RepID=UPI000C057436|nr:uncharacterized protein LOC111324830 isoform X2 [Stylophora pistillata]